MCVEGMCVSQRLIPSVLDNHPPLYVFTKAQLAEGLFIGFIYRVQVRDHLQECGWPPNHCNTIIPPHHRWQARGSGIMAYHFLLVFHFLYSLSSPKIIRSWASVNSWNPGSDLETPPNSWNVNSPTITITGLGTTPLFCSSYQINDYSKMALCFIQSGEMLGNTPPLSFGAYILSSTMALLFMFDKPQKK